ncbi:MAG: glutamate-1-semialdehyde 2,1-aminomutase [candidate division Zixibacteria bacterium]|nr:glutamate-1-semialdehyde 2,1-aminomutase [candidate division Zixibacteria bacterium]
MAGLSVKTHEPTVLENSRRLFAQSQKVIPGGVNSPVRAFSAVGGQPRFISRGQGPYIYDADDNRYLDFCMSWGPLILGHADPGVVAAIKTQSESGTTFGACTELELKLAECIISHVEALEKIRFVSSGSEAAMSALRLARGFTGRDLILKFDGCYHGHSDGLLVKAGSGLATFSQPSSKGIPRAISSQTAVLPLDDDDALEKFFETHGSKLAAAIIEGVPANSGLLIQRPEFMKRLRELTENHGALLILDEVITGFRLGPGGAAEYYDLKPDLLTYGKIIGGGLPVGAFGGRADVMDLLSPTGPVYQAGTLSGNPLAMAAGLATLAKLADGAIYNSLETLTADFTNMLQRAMPDTRVIRMGSIFWLAHQDVSPRSAGAIDGKGIERFNRCHNQLLDQGLYLPPSGYEVCFVSAAHSAGQLSEAAEIIAHTFGAGT